MTIGASSMELSLHNYTLRERPGLIFAGVTSLRRFQTPGIAKDSLQITHAIPDNFLLAISEVDTPDSRLLCQSLEDRRGLWGEVLGTGSKGVRTLRL